MACDKRGHVIRPVGPDPQMPLPHFAKIIEAGECLLEAGEHAPHQREKHRARWGEARATRAAMKELHLVLFLDITDLTCNRGLTDCETTSSSGKAPLRRNREECPCLRRCHRFGLWSMPKIHICLIPRVVGIWE